MMTNISFVHHIWDSQPFLALLLSVDFLWSFLEFSPFLCLLVCFACLVHLFYKSLLSYCYMLGNVQVT